MRILQDAEPSTPLVSLPKNFTEKKKKIQQMVPISKHDYTQFTQNQSQFTQKSTNGTNLKNQQNLLKA